MKLTKIKALRYLMVASTFIASALVYTRLPAQIPLHWNINWEVDNWGSPISIWFLPGLLAAMLVLFEVLPRFDPRKQNYEDFRPIWEAMQTIILGFLVFVFYWQLYAIFRPTGTELTGRFFIGALGVMFMLLGNISGKVRQNYFVGVKTPWALDNAENWQKTQRVGGWTMFLAGAAFMLSALAGGGYIAVFIVSIIAMVAVPIGYSYWIYKHKPTDKSSKA